MMAAPLVTWALMLPLGRRAGRSSIHPTVLP